MSLIFAQCAATSSSLVNNPSEQTSMQKLFAGSG
jgi:hypothetical protein